MQNFVRHNGRFIPTWSISFVADRIYRFACRLMNINPVEYFMFKGERMRGHGQQVEIDKRGGI